MRSEVLQHPNGTSVVLLGTQHVSATHGCLAREQIESGTPAAVVLELDQDRFQQLNIRLAHLLHHDTASLLELAAAAHEDDAEGNASGAGGSTASLLLPDALLWRQHQQQFHTMRNEGVPLLLGSLYGSDMLQAALAAASAVPTSSSSSIVLADQHHDITMERFRALAGGSVLDQMGLLLASLLPGGVAHAEAISNSQDSQHTSSNEALAIAAATPKQQQQQQPLLSSAFSIAAGRLLHLCLHWWSMALCSQSDWYGQHLHPVFLLPHNPQLQQRLQQHGVQGVEQAAAAAGRLLEAASAGALPAPGDLTAVRQFAASLEEVQRQAHIGGSENGSGEVRSEVLLPTRPWWLNLSEKFSGSLMGDNSSSSSVMSPMNAQQQQPQQHHANHTAALAFERAVMAERNAVLTDALWEQAAAAAAEAASASNSSSGGASSWFSKAVSSIWRSTDTTAAAAPAAVLGVVGVNHLPGIVQEWRRREQQWHAQQQCAIPSSSSSSSSDYHSLQYVEADQQLQQHAALRLAATDAAAGVLEMCAVGSIGVAYLTAVGKLTQPTAAAARSAGAAAAAARWGGQQMPLGGSGKLLYGFAAAGAAAAAGTAPGATRFAHSATTSSSSNSSVGRSWMLGGISRTALSSSQTAASQLAQSAPAAAQAAAQAAAARAWRGGKLRIQSSHHLTRLGLLLLPVGVALLPLQRDAGRFQEASELLHSIAVVNDEMLSQGQFGSGMASLFELAGAVSRGKAAAA